MPMSPGPQGGDGVTWAGILYMPQWLGHSHHAKMVAAEISKQARLCPTPVCGYQRVP